MSCRRAHFQPNHPDHWKALTAAKPLDNHSAKSHHAYVPNCTCGTFRNPYLRPFPAPQAGASMCACAIKKYPDQWSTESTYSVCSQGRMICMPGMVQHAGGSSSGSEASRVGTHCEPTLSAQTWHHSLQNLDTVDLHLRGPDTPTCSNNILCLCF